MINRRDHVPTALFLLPGLVLFAVFLFVPVLQTLFYSLHDWNAIEAKVFIGARNFRQLFSDRIFAKAALHVAYLITGSLFVQIPIGFLLAYALYSRVKGAKVLQTLFFLPVVISNVSIALVFSLAYEPNFGLANTLLSAMTGRGIRIEWLGDPSVVPFAAILPQIWQYVGFMTVILFAGLQQVPESILEAAELDGVSGPRKVLSILIPLTWDVIQVCIIIAVVGPLKSFEHVWVLTEGGPDHSSDLLGTFMYDRLFMSMEYGYGSSIAVIILLTAFAFTLVFKKYFSKDSVEL
jgi:raffinose/stachyose/melibiose transport system permease protein